MVYTVDSFITYGVSFQIFLENTMPSTVFFSPSRFSHLLAFALALATGVAANAATLQVTSNSDALDPGGACTLRGAVDAINNSTNANNCTATGAYGTNDTITFASSLAGNTIQFTLANGGEIQILKTLTIDASAALGLTLRGDRINNTFRLLNVVNAATPLTVRHLVFTNAGGWTFAPFDGGGAISSESDVTAENCTFTQNVATWGNAIYSPSDVKITVKESTFSNNVVNSFCGVICFGTSAQGTVESIDSVFENNQASNGAAIYAETVILKGTTPNTCRFSNNSVGGNAGAVYANVFLDVENCTFENNHAGSFGGAIYAAIDGTVANSVFTGNQADFDGGAIYGAKALTVSESTFANNKAVSTSSSSGKGGAIAGDTINVGASTFSENQATTGSGQGGAIQAATGNISASTFTANAALNGGAIAAGDLYARHLTVVNNIATASAASVYMTGTGHLSDSLLADTGTMPHCAGGGNFTDDHEDIVWHQGSGDDTSCGADLISVPASTPINQIVAITLNNNGGPTQTLALPSSTSPAFEKATSTYSQMLDPTTGTWVAASADQRGYLRPATSGHNADLGAFEIQANGSVGTAIPLFDGKGLVLLALLLLGIGWGMWRARLHR